MKPLNAGELRTLVTILQQQNTSSISGAITQSFVAAAVVWAKVEPLTGKNLELMRSMGGTETHRVTMRFRPGIVADGSIRMAYPAGATTPHTLTLNSVSDVEERHYVLIITATEDLKR